MGWHETVFEREAIYKQVWAETVRNVAERYGISDVGLRKICQKLGVPTPALGYWSKVAAGKASRAIPLPAKYDGPTAHAHMRASFHPSRSRGGAVVSRTTRSMANS